jgi:predicted phosphoribosyltransferase
MLSGLLGIIAASMHLCKCCQDDASLAAPVKTTFVLATITGVLDAVVCVQMFLQFFVGRSSTHYKSVTTSASC